MITDAQIDAFTKAFHHRLNQGAVPGEDHPRRWREAMRVGVEAAVAEIGKAVEQAPERDNQETSEASHD